MAVTVNALPQHVELTEPVHIFISDISKIQCTGDYRKWQALIGRELRFLSLQSPLGDYSNDGFQILKWGPDLLMFRSHKLSSFVLVPRIVTNVVLPKQLVISGSLNIADIHAAFGD